MKYLAVLVALLLVSCKAPQKCDAYTEDMDIHKKDLEIQKKYQTTETVKL